MSKVHFISYKNCSLFKGALPDLRQFLATEISLKMVKNAFYFTSEAFRSEDI